MLNSIEHEIPNAYKRKNDEKIKKNLALKLSDVVSILLINVKMPTIVDILTLMSRIKFMRVELNMNSFNNLQANFIPIILQWVPA